MSLRRTLVRIIQAEGPIAVSRYMELCLHDPDFGYYATRPRLGAEGDFITAPHVSQMLGELLGIWASEVFQGLGRPAAVRLVELGPGDGTMMTDVLRAIRSASPALFEASHVLLLESSPALRQVQADALGGCGRALRWIERLEEAPDDAPVILLANEFLDCMPIEQAVRTDAGWVPRRVGLGRGDRLRFVLEQEPLVALAGIGLAAPNGAVIEWSPAAEAVGRCVGALLVRATGAAVFLDYGHAERADHGDTLQALGAHARECVFARPGETDLTAHVGFDPFLAAAHAASAVTPPLRSQADFLRALGVEARAARLMQARPDQAAKIDRQLRRLTGADQMGVLFKAACIHSPGLAPPGFPPDT